MERRELLKWMSGALGAATAAIVGLPGARYIFGTLQHQPVASSTHQRVARLADLRTGVPLQVSITGQRQDAWTTHARETIGRVWLIRQDSGDSHDASTAQVTALTTICPHMGCQIQMHADRESFVCPCHQAAFAIDGAPLKNRQAGGPNHTPRGMDSLDCRVACDEQTGECWVEVRYEQFETGLTHKVTKA